MGLLELGITEQGLMGLGRSIAAKLLRTMLRHAPEERRVGRAVLGFGVYHGNFPRLPARMGKLG